MIEEIAYIYVVEVQSCTGVTVQSLSIIIPMPQCTLSNITCFVCFVIALCAVKQIATKTVCL